MRAIAICVLFPLLAGCFVQQSYLVDNTEVSRATARWDSGHPPAWIRATREEDGAVRWLRADVVSPGMLLSASPASSRAVRLEMRVYSPRRTVAAVLLGAGLAFASAAVGISTYTAGMPTCTDWCPLDYRALVLGGAVGAGILSGVHLVPGLVLFAGGVPRPYELLPDEENKTKALLGQAAPALVPALTFTF